MTTRKFYKSYESVHDFDVILRKIYFLVLLNPVVGRCWGDSKEDHMKMDILFSIWSINDKLLKPHPALHALL